MKLTTHMKSTPSMNQTKPTNQTKPMNPNNNNPAETRSDPTAPHVAMLRSNATRHLQSAQERRAALEAFIDKELEIIEQEERLAAKFERAADQLIGISSIEEAAA